MQPHSVCWHDVLLINATYKWSNGGCERDVRLQCIFWNGFELWYGFEFGNGFELGNGFDRYFGCCHYQPSFLVGYGIKFGFYIANWPTSNQLDVNVKMCLYSWQ